MRKGYTILTRYQQLYVYKHYKTESAASMARRFGVTRMVIRVHMKAWDLRPTKYQIAATQSNERCTALKKEYDFIKKNYLILPINAMSKKLGRSETFIKTGLKRMRLTIPKEILEKRKKETCFQPGSISPNKGKKMDLPTYKKCKSTMFKPGQIPKNTLWNGAITTRRDHADHRLYKWIRIKPRVWVLLSRYNYKKFIGKIPSKHMVTFKDGNALNCDPSNLKLISMAENANRNRDSQYPPEVREVIRLNNKLKKAINAKKQNRRSAQSSVRSTRRSVR